MKFMIKDFGDRWCTAVNEDGFIYLLHQYEKEENAQRNLHKDSLMYIEAVIAVSSDKLDYLKDKRDEIADLIKQQQ